MVVKALHEVAVEDNIPFSLKPSKILDDGVFCLEALINFNSCCLEPKLLCGFHELTRTAADIQNCFAALAVFPKKPSIERCAHFVEDSAAQVCIILPGIVEEFGHLVLSVFLTSV